MFTAFERHDVTGFGMAIEMHLDQTSIKLPQHILDSPLDARIVSAVTSDEFLDNGPKRCWRQFCVWDTHRIS